MQPIERIKQPATYASGHKTPMDAQLTINYNHVITDTKKESCKAGFLAYGGYYTYATSSLGGTHHKSYIFIVSLSRYSCFS